jgi:hypothetical protein
VIAPSLEFLFRRFQACSGLFVLGAGASAPTVGLGYDFLTGPALDYVRGGSFPVDLPASSELTRKIIGMARNIAPDRICPHRVLRPGTDVIPYWELLDRLPRAYTRLNLKYDLSKYRYGGNAIDNYSAFRLFAPSLLLNYNLDGLAEDYCGDIHEVLTPHGTVEAFHGAPGMVDIIKGVRDFDFDLDPDRLNLCEDETISDMRLVTSLLRMWQFSPAYIAIIGYTFGRNGAGHDDWVSLESFEYRFSEFDGDIYVIEPQPAALCEMLRERLKSKRVIGVRGYWNVLSHAFLQTARALDQPRSLNWVCEDILDRLGDRIAFPLGKGAAAR